jgi:hypothetical protein
MKEETAWREMAELGPWMIAAHTKGQAEYVARSLAEQEGSEVTGLDVSGGTNEIWHACVTVPDAEGPAGHAPDDGQVMGFDSNEQVFGDDVAGAPSPPDSTLFERAAVSER